MVTLRQLGVLVLASALVACGRAPSQEMAPPPLPEDVHTVEVRTISEPATRGWDGVVEAQQRADIAAQIAGRIEEVRVDVDQQVAAGELLLRIDAALPRAALETAVAQRAAQQATLAEAERQFERVRALVKSGHLSTAQLDVATAGRDAARAALRAAEAQVEQARQQLAYTEVRAPFAGVVERRWVEPGETVAPGTPLLVLYAPSGYRVEVELPHGQAASLADARAASITLADGRRVEAADAIVFPAADALSHSVRVRLDLPALQPPPRPGTAAKVWFRSAGSGAPRLAIPRSSVLQRGELNAAYVVEDGRLRLRQLRLGAWLGEEVEVLSGLRPGERVALEATAAARFRARIQQGQSDRG